MSDSERSLVFDGSENQPQGEMNQQHVATKETEEATVDPTPPPSDHLQKEEDALNTIKGDLGLDSLKASEELELRKILRQKYRSHVSMQIVITWRVKKVLVKFVRR